MCDLPPAQRRLLSKSIGAALRSIMGVPRGAPHPHLACGYFDTCDAPAHILFSHQMPSLSIEEYIQRLMTYMQCDEAVYRTATLLVARVALMTAAPAAAASSSSPAWPSVVTPWSVHRLFLAAAIIASKCLDDEPKHMHLFASCGGLQLRETCVIERVLLGLLQFNTFVSSEQFRAVNRSIDAGFMLPPLCIAEQPTATPAAAAAATATAALPHSASAALCAAAAVATACRPLVVSLSPSSSGGELSGDEMDDDAIEVVCA